MPLDLPPLEFLGFVAGATVAFAAVPKVIRMLAGYPASQETMNRNLLVLIGNLLWVLFGLLKPSVAIAVFCGINAVLHLLIVLKLTSRPRDYGSGACP